MSLRKKLQKISNILTQQPGVVVALSGGVDSTLLLKLAKNALQDRVIAVTASSPLHPQHELDCAKRIAKKLRCKHVIFKSDELKKKKFTINPQNRCYLCKTALFRNMAKIAARSGYTVIEASNASDLQDYRPGLRALRELKIVSPFIEAGLHKHEIRKLAREYSLPNWNKPAMACLATRVPFGRKITKKLLQRIESAEDYLRKLKITQVRVRDHDPIARIEVSSQDFKNVMHNRTKITKYFHKLGYTYVTLDLAGYKTGSMNPRKKSIV